MISLCGSCIHSDTCTGDNDDYADEPGGLCVHYRRKKPDPCKECQEFDCWGCTQTKEKEE